METIIRQLTEQHPESVAQLLRAYGYQAEPTERNLTNLVRVHGNKPLPFSNATDVAKPKKTLAEVIAGGIEAVSKVISAVKTGAIPTKPVIFGPSGIQPNTIEPTPRIFGINRTLFISLAALTVIAVAIILFKK